MYFVENQSLAQSNYSNYKLPFDSKLVVLLLVVPEIEATRFLGHFSPQSLLHGSTTRVFVIQFYPHLMTSQYVREILKIT